MSPPGTGGTRTQPRTEWSPPEGPRREAPLLRTRTHVTLEAGGGVAPTYRWGN